ncbi:hypothetical protein D3C72_1114270 [compost metagenome]
MIGYISHTAYNTLTGNHCHIFTDTVGSTTVDRDIVVAVIYNRVIDHAGSDVCIGSIAYNLRITKWPQFLYDSRLRRLRTVIYSKSAVFFNLNSIIYHQWNFGRNILQGIKILKPG